MQRSPLRNLKREQVLYRIDVVSGRAPLEVVLALSILAQSACGGSNPTPDAPPPPSVPVGELFAPDLWAEVEAIEDPFDDRPATVDCGPGGFGMEAGVLEVETEICDYLTASQPLPASLPAGAVIKSVVWHLALVNDTPATGHVALRIGEHLVFEATPAIPGPEMVYPVEWSVPDDLPAGTRAYFHVHNHGYNSWRLGPVEAEAPRELP